MKRGKWGEKGVFPKACLLATLPAVVPAKGKIKTFSPAHFINRELSWLEFNQRVLDEALDPDNPLLERLKFFCIVSSNLDEFFEVRVAGIKQQIESDVVERSMDGLTASETFRAVTRARAANGAGPVCLLAQASHAPAGARTASASWKCGELDGLRPGMAAGVLPRAGAPCAHAAGHRSRPILSRNCSTNR